MKNKILLVEDNEKYLASALEVLLKEYDVSVAKDFDSTKRFLVHNSGLAGIVSDFFFPKNESNDVALGLDLVKRLCPKYNVDGRLTVALKERGLYDLLSNASKATVEYYDETDDETKNNPLVNVVKQVFQTLNPDASQIPKEDNIVAKILNDTFGMVKNRAVKGDKYYSAKLIAAINTDPSNQPLGILVGERAKELNLPIVFATSTYHHDDLTQPVINYLFRNNLGSYIDCTPGSASTKETISFWENVLTSTKNFNLRR